MNDLYKDQETPSGPVECLGLKFPSDQARREHFLKLLADKLKDPSFRSIEGFPVVSDRIILELSDPPYYTACPNPFAVEFVKKNGSSYLPGADYSKEPFTADVSEGKNDAIYNAHSYHTKVPHKAIMRYILHYTKPGDLILDCFCGTGMTGVAAQLCGDRQEVASLGYRVDANGAIFSSENVDGKEVWKRFSTLGPRNAIVSDLSPAATFIAHNYNAPTEVHSFESISKKILNAVESECGWMYQTLHQPSSKQIEIAQQLINNSNKPNLSSAGTVGKINYVVWSDIFSCPNCAGEIVFWDAAVNKDEGKVRDDFPCPHCSTSLTKRSMSRVWVSGLDQNTRRPFKLAKHKPVQINYSVGGKRGLEKKPDEADLALLARIESTTIDSWFPQDVIPDGDKTPEAIRQGITQVDYLFVRRSLASLSVAWAKAPSSHKWAVTGSLQRASKQHQIAISRVGGEKAGEGGATAGHRRGTLYIPSNQVEMSVLTLLDERLKQLMRSAKRLPRTTLVGTRSATDYRELPDESLDYIFIDPPFGSNIMYSELSFIWEAWLQAFTNIKHEAIENKTQSKDLEAYRRLIRSCFTEAHRLLKPGRWITIEFSNTQASVWNSIQSALSEAGFVVANVAALDKKRGGLNAIVGVTAVKQDLIISAYKPNGGLEGRFKKSGGTEDSVWDFVRTHLKYLPIVKVKSGELEFIAERDPRIIFDRMVAWFVRHNTPVPMSTHEFQAGLTQRFVERDGMIFLTDQVGDYDKKRSQVAVAPQMEMFVSDERSAIDWLTDFLKKRPSTYQEIHPEFISQLGAGWKKHESKPELSSLLEDNFIQYDGVQEVPSQIHSYLSSNHKDLRGLDKGSTALIAKAKDRWYVPDTTKAQDLDKKRERALLKEFEGYQAATGRKLKEFRLEVLRAGFKAAWAAKNYKAIIAIAQKIPEEALQEDEKLLLWYDQALTRTEAGA
jgi:DNA modification methylase